MDLRISLVVKQQETMPKYTCTQTGQTFNRKKDYLAHLESLVQTLPAPRLPPGRIGISLFSGAGGDTVGLERAGVSVVAFSENNKACVQTHKDMFPHSKWLGESVKGDISKIPDEEFQPYAGNTFIVFAGFPCQGFSNAGKKNAADPRNRMFYEFLRIVQIVRPKWIMGENVAGLLTKKTDDGQSSVIDVIQGHFTDIGYPVVFQVYDMSTVGVPQSRKRLAIVGNRLDIPFELPTFSEPRVGLTSIAEQSLDAAIETSLPIPDHCLVSIPEDMEITGTPHPFMIRKHKEGRISFGKRDSPLHSEVLDLRKPCKTIICAYTFQPRLYIGLRKPSGKTYIRCLTVREAAQIQGFPATHRFAGSRDDAIKQIGNAVPALFVERMVRQMIAVSPHDEHLVLP